MVQLLNTQVDVFYYKFTYMGRFSVFKYPNNAPWGVDHGDDVQYLAEFPLMAPIYQSDDPEYKMVQIYTRLITNFASTG